MWIEFGPTNLIVDSTNGFTKQEFLFERTDRIQVDKNNRDDFTSGNFNMLIDHVTTEKWINGVKESPHVVEFLIDSLDLPLSTTLLNETKVSREITQIAYRVCYESLYSGGWRECTTVGVQYSSSPDISHFEIINNPLDYNPSTTWISWGAGSRKIYMGNGIEQL